MGDGTIINRNSWLYKDPDDPYALPVAILPKGGFDNTEMCIRDRLFADCEVIIRDLRGGKVKK